MAGNGEGPYRPVFPPLPRVPTRPLAFDLGVPGTDRTAVVLLRQAGGQIADVLRGHDLRVDVAAMVDALPAGWDEHYRREIERRRALLAPQIERAMRLPGFRFAEHAFGGPALDRLLREGYGYAPPAAAPPPTSKRRRRRLRGRERMLRRLQPPRPHGRA